MNMANEREIKRQLLSIANGDKSALSPIYDAMSRSVFLFAYSIVNDRSHAENIMQDTFITILEKAIEYRGGNAKSWIFTVARNAAYDLIRKNSREFTCEDISLYVKINSITNDIEQSVFLEEMLSQLEEIDRKIVFLRVYENISHREIAKIIGITAANSRKRYQRALSKLKVYYEKSEEKS